MTDHTIDVETEDGVSVNVSAPTADAALTMFERVFDERSVDFPALTASERLEETDE